MLGQALQATSRHVLHARTDITLKLVPLPALPVEQDLNADQRKKRFVHRGRFQRRNQPHVQFVRKGRIPKQVVPLVLHALPAVTALEGDRFLAETDTGPR